MYENSFTGTSPYCLKRGSNCGQLLVVADAGVVGNIVANKPKTQIVANRIFLAMFYSLPLFVERA